MCALARLASVALCILPFAACSQGGGAPAAEKTELAAEIDGRAITLEELDERIKEELFQSRAGSPAKLYELRSEVLEQMIRERLLEAEGKRRGVPPEAVVELEVKDLGPISEEEIQNFYQENFQKEGQVELASVRPQIQRYLENRRAAEVPRRLRERARVEVFLEAPRYEVAADGPSKGPADARITIVEFSDFQCPYCQRSVATMEQVLAKYPGDVRLVYRHLPLDRIHPHARGAAEAAACADEQGRFWDYHDKLFQNNRALAKEDLLRYASETGLDAQRFKACFEEHRFKDKVEADLQAARTVGISGTPAFVVNGILLSGAQPAEEFFEVIDAALAAPPAPAAAEGGAGSGRS
jgi:predicted DsbA family dithiol-disulfide isomerase